MGNGAAAVSHDAENELLRAKIEELNRVHALEMERLKTENVTLSSECRALSMALGRMQKEIEDGIRARGEAEAMKLKIEATHNIVSTTTQQLQESFKMMRETEMKSASEIAALRKENYELAKQLASKG